MKEWVYIVQFQNKIINMPKRPPKRWWNSCVKGVKDNESATNPEAVCGNEWYHNKTDSERKKIIRKEELNKQNK